MDVQDQDVAELLRLVLEELRTLREEALRQIELLERILRKLGEV